MRRSEQMARTLIQKTRCLMAGRALLVIWMRGWLESIRRDRPSLVSVRSRMR